MLRRLDLGAEIGSAAQRAEQATEPPPAAARTRLKTESPGSSVLLVKRQAGELEQDDDVVEAKAPIELADDRAKDDERAEERERAGERMQRAQFHDDPDDPNRNYRAYTRAHDLTVDAERLADEVELQRLREVLDRESRPLQATVARLANRLERLLLSRQLRRWRFDLEEGVLDAARLTRVIIDPLMPLSFKEEQETDFRDTTVVSVLIDNSGSMRGRPIMPAALCADVLGAHAGALRRQAGDPRLHHQGLEGRRRPQRLAGGRRPAYRSAGRVAAHRLQISRFAVASGAPQPGPDAARGAAEGKHRRRGAAVAHDRLERRSESRRILMVISDGVPLDEATLSANPGSYLEQHLRNVVRWIEKHSRVELLAIGIGHDVSDFYRRALTIAGARTAGRRNDYATGRPVCEAAGQGQRQAQRPDASQEQQMSDKVFKGSCLCGACSYEVHGPLRDVIACHCTQCRKQTGHFMAATNAQLTDFRMTGDSALRWYRASLLPGAVSAPAAVRRCSGRPTAPTRSPSPPARSMAPRDCGSRSHLLRRSRRLLQHSGRGVPPRTVALTCR